MTPEAYVISDLHVGSGAGDALEDFFADEQLAAFVGAMRPAETTLVINGDFVDFAQIEPLDVSTLPDGLLWDEDTSLLKLEKALSGHPVAFAALAGFVTGGGSLRIVVGNHDLDFVWPKVQARLRQALHDTDDRVTFVVGSTLLYGVHVEHGYQFTPENCPRDPVDFVHVHGGVERLERVWGTDFLLRFFNDLERTHHFVDNVKPTIKVAWHGLRHGWIPKKELIRLLVFLKRAGIPAKALGGAVLSAGELDESLVSSFGDHEWRQLATDALASDRTELHEALAELSAEERQVLHHPTPMVVGTDGELAPGGEATLGLFRESRETRAAQDRLGRPGVTHVVFGHTHHAVADGLDGHHFNTGSWIPHLNLDSPEVAAKVAKSGLTLDLLDDHSLYTLDLRAVRIVPGPNASSVELIAADG